MDEEECFCGNTEDKLSGMARKNIVSDMSYYRKFLIAKDDLNERKIYMLRHPRSSTGALYAFSEQIVEEVLRIEDLHRSFFYGDSVISDGSITMLCDIHPLFLVIPYLLKNAQNRYAPLEDILVDEDFPAVVLLLGNQKLVKVLLNVCNHKCVCETEVWQYNEALTLKWLEVRFEKLKKSLVENGTLHKAVKENDDVLRRYTYSILCDYIPQNLSFSLKRYLQIQDPDPLKEKQAHSLKRKIEKTGEIESYFDKGDNVKHSKPVSLNSVQKKLQEASKGTKSLLGFFNEKK